MDFQIIFDNEFFHYAQLHDLLAGKGVYNIQETFQEMVFKPLNQPFKEIINPKNIKNLLSAKDEKRILQDIKKNLNQFLEEAKKYSSSKSEILPVETEIIEKLSLILHLNSELRSIDLDSELYQELSKYLPNTDFEQAILVSWVFVHNIGKLNNQNNYELRTRSLIDDWHLTKYIHIVLKSFIPDNDEELIEKLSLIKILVKYQNLFGTISLSNNVEPPYIVRLMSDPEVQQFLYFNRYQNILWFSAERFKILVRWLLLITTIQSLLLKKQIATSVIEKTSKIINEWLEAADISGYQVQKFLEFRKNSEN